MTEIRTTETPLSGTFRVYVGDDLAGYVLVMHAPGDGPDWWNRPQGRQGTTADGTWLPWCPAKAEAIASVVAAFRAGPAPREHEAGIT